MAYAMYSEVDRIPVAARTNLWISLSESGGSSYQSPGRRIYGCPKSILVLQAGDTAARKVGLRSVLSSRKIYDEEALPF